MLGWTLELRLSALLQMCGTKEIHHCVGWIELIPLYLPLNWAGAEGLFSTSSTDEKSWVCRLMYWNPMLRDRFSVIVFSLGHWLLWWKWQLTVLLVPTPCTQCNFFHGWNQISHTLHKHSKQMWGSDPADYLIENVQLWTWRISPEPLNVMEQFQISCQSHTRLGNQKISSIGLCPATEILHLQKQTCICIPHWILTSWKNFKTSLMLINSRSLP